VDYCSLPTDYEHEDELFEEFGVNGQILTPFVMNRGDRAINPFASTANPGEHFEGIAEVPVIEGTCKIFSLITQTHWFSLVMTSMSFSSCSKSDTNFSYVH
jgi:hypothetical protein